VNYKLKTIIKVILLTFVVFSVVYAIIGETGKNKSANDNQALKETGNKIIVYYFHGNARCTSCYRIEEWSYQAITEKFPKEIQEGKLEWRLANVEDADNQHFVKDFSLHTKSIVLVQIKDGKQVKWKNLEKVWDYLRDKDRFTNYVDEETNEFLKGI